jgi:hypothetical protein
MIPGELLFPALTVAFFLGQLSGFALFWIMYAEEPGEIDE